MPDQEDGLSVNLYPDVEEDSVSEPVKAGFLPPSHRVRGKSSPMRQGPCLVDELVDLEMEFSRDGVPDLHPAPASSPVSAPHAVSSSSPADFLADPDPADESHSNSCALNRESPGVCYSSLGGALKEPIGGSSSFGDHAKYRKM